MGRRSDVEIVVDLFRQDQKQQGLTTVDRLIDHTVASRQNWTRERARRAVDRATQGDDPPLHKGRGGTLKFFGSDATIYDDVAKGIPLWTSNKPWKVDEVIDVHSTKGRVGDGDWRYPDLLVLTDPLRRMTATTELEIHAIEVEHKGGFSIRSVYQALEQGRGANGTWVFFVGDLAEWKPLAVKGRRRPKAVDCNTRILRAAIEHGVGLVVMGRPNARSTWHKICAPRRTLTGRIDRADRQSLLEATKLVGHRSLDQRVARVKRPAES